MQISLTPAVTRHLVSCLEHGLWHVAGLGLLGCVACSKPDDVHVRITYAADTAAAPLQHVQAIVGANKSSWPQLLPGESVSVVLNPDGEPPELSLLFELAKQKYSWEAPQFTPQGFAIAIAIHADGSVSERHCVAPCALPE
ncbi:MAG TPA: hypothetical protein VG963_12530 [Polyangiaceae bacterium]|nr:hypothetical protein [Polyangiaceae bacterium]